MGLKSHPDVRERKKIVRLVAEGKSKAEISRVTGRSRNAIEKSIEKYPEELAAYQEKYREKLMSEVIPSVERIIALRDTSKRDGVRLASAKDLLDRAESHLGNLGQKKFTIVLNLNKEEKPDRDVIDVEPSE